MNHKKRIKALIKKTPSYDYQRQVMQKHGEFINELCKDRMEQVLYNYLGATMMVLRDKYGFGRQRLENTMRDITVQVGHITSKHATAEDMIALIESETGFNLPAFVAKMAEERKDDVSNSI